MARNFSTKTTGFTFDEATIQAVWNKGTAVNGYDAAKYRRDACGAWMQRDQYGQTAKYGWEIDHIKPVSQGGPDDLSNLQPLYWENNRHKSDSYPNWTCKVRAA